MNYGKSPVIHYGNKKALPEAGHIPKVCVSTDMVEYYSLIKREHHHFLDFLDRFPNLLEIQLLGFWIHK